jgi:hypothetical protein
MYIIVFCYLLYLVWHTKKWMLKSINKYHFWSNCKLHVQRWWLDGVRLNLRRIYNIFDLATRMDECIIYFLLFNKDEMDLWKNWKKNCFFVHLNLSMPFHLGTIFLLCSHRCFWCFDALLTPGPRGYLAFSSFSVGASTNSLYFEDYTLIDWQIKKKKKN